MRDWLRLLRHVTRLTITIDRRTSALLVLLSVGQAGVIAALGLSQAWLVDSSTADRTGAVAGAVALGAVAYGISTAAARIQGNLWTYLTGRVRPRLNEETQRTISSIPTITHLEHGPHIDRWDRIFKSSEAMSALPWSTLDAVAAVVSLAVTVGLLVWVTPVLALLALLAVPLFLANRHSDRLLRRARDENTQLLRRERRLHELCLEPEPAKEVMLAGIGATLDERATGLWAAAAAHETRARLRAAAAQGGAWLLYAAAVAAALIVVAELIGAGDATVGTAVLVVSLATQLQTQLRAVLTNLSQVAEAGQVVGHYWWLRRYADEMARPGAPAPDRLVTGVTLHDVHFRYPAGEQDVLKGVSLHLPAGSTVAVVGANGAGKSTLIKLLTGVYEPTAGQISVDGEPLAILDRDGWRSRLSGVYQDFARLRLLVRETVGVGSVRHIRDRPAVVEAVDRAGARLPFGLDTQLGAAFGGIEPSLGQWQRLALARSLMREVTGERPPLCVVLDEPTAALDPLAEHEMFQHFVTQVQAARREGAVTVLVSHRFTTVRMADLIVVLADGRVTEQGTHAELMAAGGSYAELYALQERAYR
jgi:ATP-binding cassette subfamily B protein